MVFIGSSPTVTSSAQINPGVVETTDLADGAVTNAKVNASAAIAYSKLALTGEILAADIKAAAGIEDSKLGQITTAGKVDGAALTGLASIPAGAGSIPSANAPAPSIKCGTTTRTADTASGDQDIAHGLGKTPAAVLLMAHAADFSTSNESVFSNGSYDGTNTVSWRRVSYSGDPAVLLGNSTTYAIDLIDKDNTDKDQATVSVDGTNITLSWTKTGSPASVPIYILWVAIG